MSPHFPTRYFRYHRDAPGISGIGCPILPFLPDQSIQSDPALSLNLLHPHSSWAGAASPLFLLPGPAPPPPLPRRPRRLLPQSVSDAFIQQPNTNGWSRDAATRFLPMLQLCPSALASPPPPLPPRPPPRLPQQIPIRAIEQSSFFIMQASAYARLLNPLAARIPSSTNMARARSGDTHAAQHRLAAPQSIPATLASCTRFLVCFLALFVLCRRPWR